MKEKKIVFFNGFYLPHLGGVERYTNKLCEELKKYYKIIIVTTNYNKNITYETIDGIDIYRLPVYNIFKNRYPIIKKNKEYYKIIKKINDMEIDHIICNTRYYQTSLIGAEIAKNKKTDLLIIDHSSNYVTIGNKFLDKLGSFYEDYLTKKIKSYNPRFYGVSKKCNEWLKHFEINASGVFYNSIDKKVYDNFYSEKEDKKTIISYIGRIIPEKGIVNLLDVYEDLKEKYDNIELIVAGDGSILEKLKKNYKNVNFLGKIDYKEVMKLCAKTDIFVHPSMYPEGLPTSILEAGIMKTAVIATDRGGTKEIINNNKIGLIIEENKSDLKNKLIYLIENPDKVAELKENIHNRIIKNFTWEQTAKSVKEELEKYE